MKKGKWKITMPTDNKRLLYTWIVLCIGVLFVTSLLTPMWADDFANINRLRSIEGGFWEKFIQIQKELYFSWAGRILGNAFTILLLGVERIWFHIMNTIVYIIFVYLLVLHSNIQKRNTAVWFIIIHFILWMLLPSFWESILWVTGSGNYLWPFTILLVALYPYRVFMEYEVSPSRYNMLIFVLLMLFLGIMAGASNENTGLAFWVTVTLYLIYLKNTKGGKVHSWMLMGDIGGMIGWIIMIISPGNFHRAEAAGLQSTSVIRNLMVYSVKETVYFFDYFGWLIIMFGILLGIYVWIQGKDIKKILPRLVFYLLFLLISVYSMTVVNGIASRGWLLPLSFFVIMVGNVFAEIDFQEIKIKKFLNIFLVGIMLISTSSYTLSIVNNVKIHSTMKDMVKTILEEKEKGNMDVVYQLTFEVRNTHSVPLDQLSSDSSFWSNVAITEYYGIHSFSVLPVNIQSMKE